MSQVVCNNQAVIFFIYTRSGRLTAMLYKNLVREKGELDKTVCCAWRLMLLNGKRVTFKASLFRVEIYPRVGARVRLTLLS